MAHAALFKAYSDSKLMQFRTRSWTISLLQPYTINTPLYKNYIPEVGCHTCMRFNTDALHASIYSCQPVNSNCSNAQPIRQGSNSYANSPIAYVSPDIFLVVRKPSAIESKYLSKIFIVKSAISTLIYMLICR